MDAENCKLACGLVSRAYIDQGSQALAKRHRLVKALLSQRRLPADGWDDATIEMFIQVSGIWCRHTNDLATSSVYKALYNSDSCTRRKHSPSRRACAQADVKVA